MFWFSDHKAYENLSSLTRFEPGTLALEGEVLTSTFVLKMSLITPELY